MDRTDLAEKIQVQEAVQNFLMARSYDADSGCYALADLSVGRILELVPLQSTAFNDDQREQINVQIASAITRIPDHGIVSFHIIPTPNLSAALTNFRQCGGNEDPVLMKFRETIERQFIATAKKPMFSIAYGEGSYRTVLYRVIVVVIARPTTMVGGTKNSIIDYVADLLSGGGKKEKKTTVGKSTGPLAGVLETTAAEARFKDLKESLTSAVVETTRRMIGTFQTQHVEVQEVDPVRLIELYQALLMPNSCDRMKVRHDPHRQIADQVVQSEVVVEPGTGTVLTDGAFYKTLTLVETPEATATGMLTMPNNEVLGGYSLLDFLGDGFITISAIKIPRNEMRNYIANRKKRINGDFCMPSKKDRLLHDCLQAEKDIEEHGVWYFNTAVTICVRGTTEREAHVRAERLRDKAGDLGLPMRIEGHYAPSSFFQALPFGFAPTIKNEPKRCWRMPDYALADISPHFGLGRGTKRYQVMLRNRYGEPFAWHPFDTTSAPHTLIVGDSGTGKSFLANFIIDCVLGQPKAQVFSMDKGGSFSVQPTIIGPERSQAVALTMSGGKACTNPFAGTHGFAEPFAIQLLGHLCAQTEKDKLDADALGVLREGIMGAFKGWGPIPNERYKRTTWKDYQELVARHPRGVWIEKARKRLLIKPIDDTKYSTIQGSKANESGRDHEWEFYQRAILTKRTHTNQETKKEERDEIIGDPRGLTKATRSWLEGHGFLIDEVVQDGASYTLALYEGRDKEAELTAAGFSFHPDNDTSWVLEVGMPEDMVQLQRLGVEPLYDPAFIADMRVTVAAEVAEEYPNAPADRQQAIIDERMGRIHSIEYFNWLEGYAWLQHEVTFSDVARVLLLHPDQERAKILLARLAPYYGNGSLARFFDGPTSYHLDSKFYFNFELKDLAQGGNHLLTAVVGTVLQSILLYSQSSHLPDGGPRAWTKYLVLDEFFELMRSPMLAELVVTILKVGRKFGLCLVTISQLIADYQSTELGKIIVASSQTKIMLAQPVEQIPKFQEWLGWSPEKCALMASVVSVKGVFSEALVDISNLGVCEVARFVCPPEIYWMYTTDRDDVAFRTETFNDIRGREPDLLPSEAMAATLDRCAREAPNGILKARQAKRSA